MDKDTISGASASSEVPDVIKGNSSEKKRLGTSLPLLPCYPLEWTRDVELRDDGNSPSSMAAWRTVRKLSESTEILASEHQIARHGPLKDKSEKFPAGGNVSSVLTRRPYSDGSASNRGEIEEKVDVKTSGNTSRPYAAGASGPNEEHLGQEERKTVLKRRHVEPKVDSPVLNPEEGTTADAKRKRLSTSNITLFEQVDKPVARTNNAQPDVVFSCAMTNFAGDFFMALPEDVPAVPDVGDRAGHEDTNNNEGGEMEVSWGSDLDGNDDSDSDDDLEDKCPRMTFCPDF